MTNWTIRLMRKARLAGFGMILAALATPGTAGNLTGAVSDPQLVGPEKFADDVSAFYLGFSAGYGRGGDDRFGLRTTGGTLEIGELDPSGFYGGLRGGWRGVLPARGGRDYVYGFEIGYDFGSIEDTVSARIGTSNVQAGSEISDMLSLRFRNGLTNRRGSVLYFVSLGYVRGKVTTSTNITSGGSTQTFEDNDRRDGLSASIGAEHQFNEHWSITGEFEYVQFDSKDVDLGTSFSTKSTPSYRGLRVGLNYRF